MCACSVLAIIGCLYPVEPPHKLTVHAACIEAYADQEIKKFLKCERMHTICTRLPAGGGAKATVVSNTVLKKLGLSSMLDACCGGK